jgi:cell division protein FtsW (lipid II flippase)
MPEIDMPLALAALGLVCVGLLMVYSATSIPGAHEGLWSKQLMWAAVAFAAAWIVAAVDHRVYDSLAWPLYGISLLLLVAVLVLGSSAYGAKRWLDLGPLKFQPSELAKIATVLVPRAAVRRSEGEADARGALGAGGADHDRAVPARAQGAGPRHVARVPR